MRRRNYRKKESLLDIYIDFGLGIIGLYFLYLLGLYISNRNQFFKHVIYWLVGFFVFLAIPIGIKLIKKSKIRKIEKNIIQKNLKDRVNNFISSFGAGQDKSDNPWRYRNYQFDWKRINDFQNELGKYGIKTNPKQISAVLRDYIDEREYERTVGGSQNIPKKFNNLSGTEFEGLLYQLFEKMGYSVVHTGKIGDQGGDLVIQKGEERIIVQAKKYRDAVGNKSIQEAVAAKNFYNCNQAMAVTTGTFTNEAIQLAKANNVELISKQRLQELLLKYLGENWS